MFNDRKMLKEYLNGIKEEAASFLKKNLSDRDARELNSLCGNIGRLLEKRQILEQESNDIKILLKNLKKSTLNESNIETYRCVLEEVKQILSSTSSSSLFPGVLLDTLQSLSLKDKKTPVIEELKEYEESYDLKEALTVSGLPDMSIPPLGMRRFTDGCIQIEEFLGAGYFGTVYKGTLCGSFSGGAKNSIESNKKINLALKQIDNKASLDWEASRLSTVIHPNLVQFYGIYQDFSLKVNVDTDSEVRTAVEETTYLAMEYCAGGNLRNALEKKPSLIQRWQWALQLAEGLAYLHSHGVLHRDLKEDNIFLSEQGCIRIGDLGVARVDKRIQIQLPLIIVNKYAGNELLPAGQLSAHNQTDDLYPLGRIFKKLFNEPCPEELRKLADDLEQRTIVTDEEVIQQLANIDFEQPEDKKLARLIKACQILEGIIYQKCTEKLKYVAPYVSDYPIEQDMESFWEQNEGKDNYKISIITKLENFLNNTNEPVFLLLGEGGLGKTLSSHLFASNLLSSWWAYIKNPKLSKSPVYFPVLVYAASYKDLNLTAAVNNIFPDGKPDGVEPLFILDAYNEYQDRKQENLPEKLNLSSFGSTAKLLVSARVDTVPRLEWVEIFGQNGQLQTTCLLPFNTKQLLEYVTANIDGQAKDLDKLNDALKNAKKLRIILRNPFVLSLFLRSWETISKRDLYSIKRAQIYECFVEHLFSKYKDLIFSENIQERLTDKDPKVLWRSFENFAADIAWQAFTEKRYSLEEASAKGPWAQLEQEIVEYGRKNFNEDESISASKRNIVTKQSATLASKKINSLSIFKDYNKFTDFMVNRFFQQFQIELPMQRRGNKYQFSHQSFFEFFLAKRILQLEPSVEELAEEEKIITLDLEICAGTSEAIHLPVHIGITKHFENTIKLLKPRILREEPGVFQFLIDIGLPKNLKETLFAIIKFSKKDWSIGYAASNAITVLNACGASFSSEDFQGIYIPSADLSGSICDNTDFTNANMENIRIDAAWLHQCFLNKAKLKSLALGEQRYFKEEAPVWCCCYSPDGQMFAAAFGKKISLYDAQSGALLHSFKRCTEEVKPGYDSLVFSPDGRWLASSGGNSDNIIRVWEVNKLKLKDESCQMLTKHMDEIYSLAFSLDGRLASGGKDKSICLWKLKRDGWQLEKTLIGHVGRINSLTFSQMGCLGSGGGNAVGDDIAVYLWDVVKGIHEKLIGHAKGITMLKFSPDGKLLASSSYDNTIRLWEVSSRTCLKILKGDLHYLISVAFNKNGRFLAAGSTGASGKIHLWDVENGVCLRVFSGHKSSVTSISFCPNDSNVLISSSPDQTVRQWDLRQRNILRQVDGHREDVKMVVFSPDGNWLASCSKNNDDNTVRLWEVPTGLCRIIAGHNKRVNSVSFSPCGNLLVSASDDKTIGLWSVDNGSLYQKLEGHTGPVAYAAFLPGGDRLVSSSWDNTVRLWRKDEPGYFAAYNSFNLRGYTGISYIAFSINGLLASTHGSTLCVREISTVFVSVRLELKHDEMINVIAFSPDGFWLASGTQNSVYLWRVSDGSLVKKMPFSSEVSKISFNPKGDRMAVSGKSCVVYLWEIDELGTVMSQELTGHTRWVESIAFSPDGSWLATGSGGGTGYHDDDVVRIWDLNGNCLLKQSGFVGCINSIHWKSKDGTLYLATGSEEGAVRYWRITSVGDRLRACLLWGAPQQVLYVQGACIEEAELNEETARFLTLKGAIGKPQLLSSRSTPISTLSSSSVSSSSLSSFITQDSKLEMGSNISLTPLRNTRNQNKQGSLQSGKKEVKDLGVDASADLSISIPNNSFLSTAQNINASSSRSSNTSGGFQRPVIFSSLPSGLPLPNIQEEQIAPLLPTSSALSTFFSSEQQQTEPSEDPNKKNKGGCCRIS